MKYLQGFDITAEAAPAEERFCYWNGEHIVCKPKPHKWRWFGEYALNVISLTAIIFSAMIILGCVCTLLGA
ncbi:MAG: hypothetical protein EOM54_11655 [Clostridia bacterium]|nr:hypothetical protein [Clostridia bacterium]